MKKISSTTIPALGIAGFIMLLGNPNSASAVTIELGGTNYEITTISGTFDDNQSSLEMQPWWGSQTVAEEAAGLVGTELGTPNFGNTAGAFFAYAATSSLLFLESSEPSYPLNSWPSDREATFAVAEEVSQVPEPSTILGIATALGFGSLFKGKNTKDTE
jgi:hypothetical protein